MPYPSVLSTFTDPSPSDRLSTTPHSAIETAQNTGIEEVQAYLGVTGANSVAGTLVYQIQSPDSNGGGHVQTANKGGTGQTAFSKGEILVASSSSVLSKLAIGNDNDFLTADSSVAAGVKWYPGVTSGQIQNMAFSYSEDSGTGSVYAIYPVPCVLSYAGGQVFSFRAKEANTITTPALSVSSLVSKTIKNADGTALYGGQIAASQMTMVQYNGHQSYFGLLSISPKSALFLSSGAASTISGATLDTEQTVFTGTVPAGYVSTGGGIHGKVRLANLRYDLGTFTIKLYYNGVIASKAVTTENFAGTMGYLEFDILPNGSDTAQSAVMQVLTTTERNQSSAIGTITNLRAVGTGSVASTSDQNIKLTVQWSSTDSGNVFNYDNYYVKSLD